MKIVAITFVLLLAACSREDSQSAGRAIGSASAAAGDAIAPTIVNAAQGYVDATMKPALDAMVECQRRRAPPRRITENIEVKGRPVKECLAESGGVINEAVLRCRNGYSTSQTHEVPYVPNPAIECR